MYGTSVFFFKRNWRLSAIAASALNASSESKNQSHF
jgi:hypothetical protein